MEPAIISMIQEACAMAGRKGVHVKSDDEAEAILDNGDSKNGEIQVDEHPRAVERAHVAVPEHRHPEESQSNGLAEKAVQGLVNHWHLGPKSMQDSLPSIQLWLG